MYSYHKIFKSDCIKTSLFLLLAIVYHSLLCHRCFERRHPYGADGVTLCTVHVLLCQTHSTCNSQQLQVIM